MEYPRHPDDPQAISIGRVRYPAGRYEHPASGLFQLRVVRSGSSYAEIDLGAGLRHVFTRPGDLLLSLGDRPAEFTIQEGRDLTFVQASRQQVSNVLGVLGAQISDLLPLADRPFRDPLVANLCARLEGPALAQLTYEWALGLILSLLLDNARRRALASNLERLTAQRLAGVEAAIDASLEGEITVASLAAVAGMAERAFSSSFREATGLPAYQFVLRRRADRASDLLRSTRIPLADIASQTGFSHQAHMTRVLKRLMGRTPAEIRAGGPDARTEECA